MALKPITPEDREPTTSDGSEQFELNRRMTMLEADTGEIKKTLIALLQLEKKRQEQSAAPVSGKHTQELASLTQLAGIVTRSNKEIIEAFQSGMAQGVEMGVVTERAEAETEDAAYLREKIEEAQEKLNEAGQSNITEVVEATKQVTPILTDILQSLNIGGKK